MSVVIWFVSCVFVELLVSMIWFVLMFSFVVCLLMYVRVVLS